MALTDRVMEHGRSLDGLAPSTYEATLAFNLASGYPIGGFLLLGIGHELVGTDVAWLIQPYMAFVAGAAGPGAMGAGGLARAAPWLRAAAAALGAQAALLLATTCGAGSRRWLPRPWSRRPPRLPAIAFAGASPSGPSFRWRSSPRRSSTC